MIAAVRAHKPFRNFRNLWISIREEKGMSYNKDIRNSKTARRLNEAIFGHGITPSQLSRETGINRASICRYLSGKCIPSEKNTEKLARALKVDPEWLQGEDSISNLSKIANIYNSLNDAGKGRILEYSESLRSSGIYGISKEEEKRNA